MRQFLNAHHIHKDDKKAFVSASGSASIKKQLREERDARNCYLTTVTLEVIVPNQDTAIIYADLASWARKHGIALSNNDLWIAATCVQMGGRLVALDQDFAHLPQIRLVNLTTI